MTTINYHMLLNTIKLNSDERLEDFTIGDVIDYAHEYADKMSEVTNDSKKGKSSSGYVRKATQSDFDMFR